MWFLVRVVFLCVVQQNLVRGGYDGDGPMGGGYPNGNATRNLVVHPGHSLSDLVRYQHQQENSLRYPLPSLVGGGLGKIHNDEGGAQMNHHHHHTKSSVEYHTPNKLEDILKYEEIVRQYEQLQEKLRGYQMGVGSGVSVEHHTKLGGAKNIQHHHHEIAQEFKPTPNSGDVDESVDPLGGHTKSEHHTKSEYSPTHGGVLIGEDLHDIGDGTIYDFIVVGSGSAGSVIASRLSENPHYKVLLLEAGKVENPITRIPVFAYAFLQDGHGWQYHTEYQRDFARGMNGHQMVYPLDKALGGTPALVYSRGNPHDYDEWAKMGNSGWSYHEVLPYFMKAETCLYPGANYEYHGKHGKVSVEGTHTSDLVDIFVNAGHELGYHKNIDYNTPHQFGFGPTQTMVLHGKRHSPAKAYLFTEKLRPNLKIATQAHVTKVLIEPHTKIAYGVKYYQKGVWKKAFATKEVVLSAGVVNTPQILMLSGVGPGYHLHDLGVPLLKDLPVGDNFQDHVAFFGLTFTTKKPLGWSFLDVFKPKKLKKYLKTGEGIHRSAFLDGVGYPHLNVTHPEVRPQIQLGLLEGSPASDFGVVTKKYFNINEYLYKKYYKPMVLKHTFTVLVSLLHPKSRGVVRLRSADPFEKPLILGNFLGDAHNHDVNTMIEGIKAVLDLSKTRIFHLYGIKLHHVPVPGCEEYEYHSHPYWECALRTLSYVHFDGAGTVKMGTHDDPTSVVDHHLRVYGIKGLRVADGSIMPVITGGHSAAVCNMIGEKAADMIKGYWDKIRY